MDEEPLQHLEDVETPPPAGDLTRFWHDALTSLQVFIDLTNPAGASDGAPPAASPSRKDRP
jgi:hypothetical protein